MSLRKTYSDSKNFSLFDEKITSHGISSKKDKNRAIKKQI